MKMQTMTTSNTEAMEMQDQTSFHRPTATLSEYVPPQNYQQQPMPVVLSAAASVSSPNPAYYTDDSTMMVQPPDSSSQTDLNENPDPQVTRRNSLMDAISDLDMNDFF
jgi:hypothetical protein